jgi:hypothetical protein
MKKILIFYIFLLIITPVLFGIIALTQKKDVPLIQNIPIPGVPLSQKGEVYTIPPLSSFEKVVLKIKKSDVEAKIRNYKTIQLAAKDVNLINVKDCKVYPIVIRIKENDNLIIVNHDLVTHKIETDLEHVVILQPDSARTITANFGHGPGLYSIVCDDENSPLVGMILVTP